MLKGRTKDGNIKVIIDEDKNTVKFNKITDDNKDKKEKEQEEQVNKE